MINYTNFKKLKSTRKDLKYIPSLEPDLLDSADYIPEILGSRVSVDKNNGNGQFSFSDCEILKEVIGSLEVPKIFVEIGISRKRTFKNSSTHMLFDFKPAECLYIGIDLNVEGLEEYKTYQPNVSIIGADSRDVSPYGLIAAHEPVDLLMIDGDHSILGFLSDWRFSDLVKVGGYIVVHDTNDHPGPFFFFDAIDENFYEKRRYFRSDSDNGIAVFRKLK